MRKKRIIIYNHKLFSISQTFVYRQSIALLEDFEIHLLAKEYMNPHGYDMGRFKKHIANKPKLFIGRVIGKLIRMKLDSSFELDLSSFMRIRKLIKKEKISAIFAHFGPNALEILGMAKAYNVPLIAAFHGHDASKLLNDEKYASKLPELFDYASAITISSKHMFDTLNLKKWEKKVYLIPYGVNPNEFKANGKTNNRTKSLSILHSGRIVPTKGVPDVVKTFIELAEIHKHVNLYVAGDGKELEYSKDLAKKSKFNDRIIFLGRVSQDKVKELLNQCDIFILNSRTDEKGDMEGTPNAILEAMCVGKPVVSTKHAGIPYVIRDGENGLLADEYANEQLFNCLNDLIVNPEKRLKLGNAARDTIIHSYTNQVMEEKIVNVLKKTIS